MTSVNVQFVAKSSNAKTGPIPVTTSDRNTCPDSCPLKGAGCYASSGYYTRLNWDKVTSGERGGDWSQLCEKVSELKPGQVWRHNVAGDMPADKQGFIDAEKLEELIQANTGKRGFTYTHHDTRLAFNLSQIKYANQSGFTINLSADNPQLADKLSDLNVGPVVSIVPHDQLTNTKTPQGRDIVICPAVTKDNVSCATCKLCAVPDRKVIIGFPAHGIHKSKIQCEVT